MTGAPASRCVLVAVDASEDALAALEVATVLAALTGSTLVALHVEDEGLREVGEHPAARLVGRLPAVPRAIAPAELERSQRGLEGRLGRAVQAAASRAKVPSRFETARGPVVDALRSRVDEAELSLLGKGRRAVGDFNRARRAGFSARRPVLFLREGEALGRPLAFVDAEADPVAVAEAVGLLLDGEREARLFVVDGDEGRRRAEQVREALARRGVTVAIEHAASHAEALELVAAVRRCTLVVAVGRWLRDPTLFEAILRRARVPVLTVP